MKKEFKVQGLELVERKVSHFKKSGSRVSVPKNWKKVMVIKIE